MDGYTALSTYTKFGGCCLQRTSSDQWSAAGFTSFLQQLLCLALLISQALFEGQQPPSVPAPPAQPHPFLFPMAGADVPSAQHGIQHGRITHVTLP